MMMVMKKGHRNDRDEGREKERAKKILLSKIVFMAVL